MKSKRILLALPTILLPYLALPIPATFILGAGTSAQRNLMESIAQYGLLYIGVYILLCILAAATMIIYLVSSIKNNVDAVSLAKMAMVVKLIHIPAYLGIFVMGFLFSIMIWTYWIAFLLILLDCFVLLLTGALSAASVVNSIRQGKFKMQDVIWMIILQNIFCADVVASCVFYWKLKKKQLA